MSGGRCSVAVAPDCSIALPCLHLDLCRFRKKEGTCYVGSLHRTLPPLFVPIRTPNHIHLILEHPFSPTYRALEKYVFVQGSAKKGNPQIW